MQKEEETCWTNNVSIRCMSVSELSHVCEALVGDDMSEAYCVDDTTKHTSAHI